MSLSSRLFYLLLLSLTVLLLICEPALANKFETIGGGLSGSSSIKRDFVVNAFYTAGGLFLIGVLLAVFSPHRNALHLDYGNWKPSAIIMGIFSIICFIVAVSL